MDVRKYGGQWETSPTEFDCRSRFTKAFFCNSFISRLWSRMAVNLGEERECNVRLSDLGLSHPAGCRQLKTSAQ